ncbi:MAG TPA: hypothetical protein VMB50_09205 [Myxococcales bacterium]|nr:hypothetical protein [Myxococcales bacterium]
MAAFAAARVEYLVVGGYAVGFHGQPRLTEDLGLWVRPSAENLGRVREALVAFGAPEALLAELDSASAEDVLWMGTPPLRIDIVKGVPGGDFEAAYVRRSTVEWQGLPVTLVPREDLIRLERASGRPQDLVDADLLESAE